MASSSLIALTRISVPVEGQFDNLWVNAGEEFEPPHDQSRERLLRIGAACEPGDYEKPEPELSADEILAAEAAAQEEADRKAAEKAAAKAKAAAKKPAPKKPASKTKSKTSKS